MQNANKPKQTRLDKSKPTKNGAAAQTGSSGTQRQQCQSGGASSSKLRSTKTRPLQGFETIGVAVFADSEWVPDAAAHRDVHAMR